MASDWMPANWWGRVTPTQPASAIVSVHGGYIWDSSVGRFRKFDDTVYDFSATSAFAVSQGYRWTVLQADVSASPPTLRIYEGSDFAALQDCEDDFWISGPGDDLYTDYYPLAVIVLRNNGNLGTAGAIETITLADTNKSYFLVKDFRPWLHLH